MHWYYEIRVWRICIQTGRSPRVGLAKGSRTRVIYANKSAIFKPFRKDSLRVWCFLDAFMLKRLKIREY